jgi:hypothetical protein
MRWIFLLTPLCLHIGLFGAYIGNPADPAIMNTGFFSSHYPFFKFTTGYVGDYVSDKRYYASQSDDSNFDPNQAFRHFGLHSQLASVSLILVERLEIFGMAGGSKEHAQWREQPTWSDAASMMFDFESNYHFSWSTGAKVVLLQWGSVFLSGEFSYFGVPSSHKSYFRFFNRLNLPMDTAPEQKFGLNEWQTSLALSVRFIFLTPYAGIDYLHSHLHVQGGPQVKAINYYNEEKFGYFYGLTLSLTGRFHVNIERRVRNEFAYGFSATAVF